MKKIELAKDARLSKKLSKKVFAILKDGKAIGHAFKYGPDAYRWAHVFGNEAAIVALAARL